MTSKDTKKWRFLRIFTHFSLEIWPMIFRKMSNLNCFHHLSTDVSKKKIEGQSHMLFRWILPVQKYLSISCTASGSTDPVPVVAMSLKHLISYWYLVCFKVCVLVSFITKIPSPWRCRAWDSDVGAVVFGAPKWVGQEEVGKWTNHTMVQQNLCL